jgi:hypothetical protein
MRGAPHKGLAAAIFLMRTSRTPEETDPPGVLKSNRSHWTIENSCDYIIDGDVDEDRSRIWTGHGLENITRLRRRRGPDQVQRSAESAQTMCQFTRNVRMTLDYPRMTENTRAHRIRS